VGRILAARSAAAGETHPPGSATYIILSVGALALVILMGSSWRWALVHPAPMDYFIVLIIAAAVVFASLSVRARLGLGRPTLGRLALWFAWATGGVGGALLFANAALDPGPAREFTTLAAGEHCGGRTSAVTVRGAPGAPPLPVAGKVRVNVGNRTCRAMRDGDTVVVVIGRGYFGRAWVHEVRPVPGARE
jgi:hypothetical protein